MNKFDGVKTSGSIDIEIMNGQQQVKVEADDNISPYIITEVEDRILRVYYKPNISLQNTNAKVDVNYKSNYSFSNTHVKIIINTPFLDRLIVSGSGSINSSDTINNPHEINIKVSGSGDIKAFVNAPSVAAEIGGSGTIILQGKTRDFKCNINGSGDIKCNKLLSENTEANITGSGTAHVFASVHLVAKIIGSGDIYYSGNPSSPDIHKTGSGTVMPE